MPDLSHNLIIQSASSSPQAEGLVHRKRSMNYAALAAGGLHHHLAASGNFGQVIPKNHPLPVEVLV